VIFEVSLALAMVLLAAVGLAHSLATRTRAQTAMLLVCGVGFGFLFPSIDINVFGHYTFHGRLTVMSFPFHLGFAWYGLYYMALALAEWVLGDDAPPYKLALLAGAVFGLLEAQWDPTLLALGAMELFLPSFAEWPLGFNVGVPMCHGLFGFGFAYGFLKLRHAPRPALCTAVLLATLVLWPMGMMATVPLLEPLYSWVGERVSQPVAFALDTVHFATSFGPAIALEGLWLRWLAKRLTGGGPG